MKTNNPSRRAVLAGAPAAAAGTLAAGTAANAVAVAVAVAVARATEVDPIFVVIAEHQEAYAGVIAAYAREDRIGDDDEITDAAEERAGDADYSLFTTAPTTVAGVAALLEYLGTDATAYNPEQTILEWANDGTGEFTIFLAAALCNIIAREQA